MEKLIAELERRNLKLRPPASNDLVSSIQAEFPKLPNDLIALYQHHDGMEPECSFPIRLMSIEEAIETTRDMRAIPELFGSKSFCPLFFWTDDNSNYAGIFIDPELNGRVFILDHDDCPAIPAYRCVDSFLNNLLIAHDNDQSWQDMTRDYPSLTADDISNEIDTDIKLARTYLDRYLNDNSERNNIWAYYAIVLMGHNDTYQLTQLLDSPDMWVQERACEILGLRRHVQAIPKLREVALHGMHNGKTASVLALKKMNTAASRNTLNELRSEMGAKYEFLFR